MKEAPLDKSNEEIEKEEMEICKRILMAEEKRPIRCWFCFVKLKKEQSLEKVSC